MAFRDADGGSCVVRGTAGGCAWTDTAWGEGGGGSACSPAASAAGQAGPAAIGASIRASAIEPVAFTGSVLTGRRKDASDGEASRRIQAARAAEAGCACIDCLQRGCGGDPEVKHPGKSDGLGREGWEEAICSQGPAGKDGAREGHRHRPGDQNACHTGG